MTTRLSPGTTINDLQIIRGLYLDHVYLAESPDGLQSVIKFAERALVDTEAAAYQLLPKSRVEYQYHEPFDKNVSMLVTKYRGRSLLQHLRLSGGRFSTQVVSKIGAQMLDRIESLHECGLIHRDIKPENFVTHSVPDKSLHLIDLAFAMPYLNTDGTHIEFQPSLPRFCGTVRYCSVNAIIPSTQSRRDDLESLAYCLIYFLHGRLPWSHLKSHDEVWAVKSRTWPLQLCKAQPDYAYLRRLLVDMGGGGGPTKRHFSPS